MLSRLFMSPAVQAATVYAVGGLCFALGNLLLARVLAPEDFGVVALVLAIAQISTTLGPLGADTIVNRKPVNPSGQLFRRVAGSSAVIGVLMSAIAWALYDLPLGITLILTGICMTAGINVVGSAFLRSRQKYGAALGLTQGHNAVLLAAAMASMMTGGDSVRLPLMILSLAYLLSCTVGWASAFRLQPLDDPLPPESFPWHEGRAIIATTIAIVILLQFERLVIPRLLDKEALAIFAVLAAVAASPFRVLQMGVGYTLVPQLRHAASTAERRDVLQSEWRVAALLTVAAGIVVWLIADPFVNWFLDGRYRLSELMIGAALIAGMSKVCASFGSAIVTALGTQRDLERLRNASWLAVGVALLGSYQGLTYGLVGILYGVSAGWVTYATCALIFGRRVFAREG